MTPRIRATVLAIWSLLFAAGLAFTAPQAQATETLACEVKTGNYTGTARGSMCFPPSQDVLVIDGPANVWNMRAFASRIDPLLDRITIVSGSCEAHPTAFCVKVVKVPNAGPGVMGRMDWDQAVSPIPGGTIRLATWVEGREMKRMTAAHELVHALGMDHHGEVGLMGRWTRAIRSTSPMPSANEIAAMQSWYNRP